MILLTGSKLRRDDGVIFICTYLGHWSDVREQNGDAVDCVKWVGDNRWVSAATGHTFVLLAEEQEYGLGYMQNRGAS
jgi:hypothetical protein